MKQAQFKRYVISQKILITDLCRIRWQNLHFVLFSNRCLVNNHYLNQYNTFLPGSELVTDIGRRFPELEGTKIK